MYRVNRVVGLQIDGYIHDHLGVGPRDTANGNLSAALHPYPKKSNDDHVLNAMRWEVILDADALTQGRRLELLASRDLYFHEDNRRIEGGKVGKRVFKVSIYQEAYILAFSKSPLSPSSASDQESPRKQRIICAKPSQSNLRIASPTAPGSFALDWTPTASSRNK